MRHEANYVIAFQGRGKSGEDQLKSKPCRTLFFPRRLSEPTNSSYVLVTPDIDWFVRYAVLIFWPKSPENVILSNI